MSMRRLRSYFSDLAGPALPGTAPRRVVGAPPYVRYAGSSSAVRAAAPDKAGSADKIRKTRPGAAADWLEGRARLRPVHLDEQLAQLLKGE
ncbi:hypothetical protein ADK53_35365 [Streptomyces sp. WM6373]|nr:hypothetical protein ADK53_35365 [Streptomyces sp. WM6373]